MYTVYVAFYRIFFATNYILILTVIVFGFVVI